MGGATLGKIKSETFLDNIRGEVAKLYGKGDLPPPKKKKKIKINKKIKNKKNNQASRTPSLVIRESLCLDIY